MNPAPILRAFWATFLLLSLPALAGPSNGGGGNALVCFKDVATANAVRKAGHQVSTAQLALITSIESVDLHEATLLQGIDETKPELVPFTSGMKVSEYAEKVASRFDPAVPRLAGILRAGERAFAGGNTRVDDAGLAFLDDADLSVFLDRDQCTLVTVARQEQTAGSSILRIDGRLYNHPRHARLSQAVLMLHELIYRQARLNGQTDSRNSRILLGAMLTQNDGRTVWGMIHLAADMGFLKVDVSETGLDRFRIQMGLDALQAGSQAYEKYTSDHPRPDITDGLLNLVGSSSSTDLSEGNVGLLLPLDGTQGIPLLTDEQKKQLEWRRDEYRKYSTDRAAAVGAAVSTFAQSTLLPRISSAFPGIPAEDKEILSTTAMNAKYVVLDYARSFLICNSAREGCRNSSSLLLALAEPEHVEEQLTPGKITLWSSFSAGALSVDGSADVDVLKELVEPDSGPKGLVIDRSHLGSDVMCYETFLHPESEFNYPLPAVK